MESLQNQRAWEPGAAGAAGRTRVSTLTSALFTAGPDDEEHSLFGDVSAGG
jgi:hypothetical protein